MSRHSLVLALLLAIAFRGLAQDVDPTPEADPEDVPPAEGLGLDITAISVDPEDVPAAEGVGLDLSEVPSSVGVDLTDLSIEPVGLQVVQRPPPPRTPPPPPPSPAIPDGTPQEAAFLLSAPKQGVNIQCQTEHGWCMFDEKSTSTRTS